MLVTVRDGRIVGVEGDPLNPARLEVMLAIIVLLSAILTSALIASGHQGTAGWARSICVPASAAFLLSRGSFSGAARRSFLPFCLAPHPASRFNWCLPPILPILTITRSGGVPAA
jgi:hypothetical protein